MMDLMRTKKFYDTCSLILDINNLIENEQNFDLIISDLTLFELEKLKNTEKDLSKLQSIRKVIRALEQKVFPYEIYFHRQSFKNADIARACLDYCYDMRILECYLHYEKNIAPDNTILVTNDLSLKNIANLFVGEDCIESIEPSKMEYTGFIEIIPTEQELSELYTNLDKNIFNLIPNQYLILRNENGEILDKLRWNGQTHKALKYGNFDSRQLGRIKPFKDDPYQAIAFDSLLNNPITLIGGPAGSGKTFIALASLFNKLEAGEIDRIVVLCNPVVAKDPAKLGFYPGTQEEKLLSSQVGNILSSKLGSIEEVERLMNNEKLILIPVGDARGYEVPQHSGVYIMEAQNLNVNLIKLILQRIGEDCICIIDGDRFTQTDMLSYEIENGMKRVSDVFKGRAIYGQVDLQQIHRSKIAQIADKL